MLECHDVEQYVRPLSGIVRDENGKEKGGEEYMERESRGVGKEQEKNTVPYVISGDLPIVLGEWARERSFTLPSMESINELRSTFLGFMQSIFSPVEFVGEQELINGMNAAIESQGFPIISMDPVYVRGTYQLSMSRMVDGDFTSMGLFRRENAPYLLTQLRMLQKENLKQACLVDDVIFEGNGGVRVIEALKKIGITIPVMIAGIAISQGKENIENNGTKVLAVRTYPSVIDEICERDFWPGVNLAGRGVQMQDGQVVGAPYVAPFGNPDWASIPDDQKERFSRFCISQSIALFTLIEQANNRPIFVEDLRRQVLFARQPGARFIDELQKYL